LCFPQEENVCGELWENWEESAFKYREAPGWLKVELMTETECKSLQALDYCSWGAGFVRDSTCMYRKLLFDYPAFQDDDGWSYDRLALNHAPL